MNRMMKNIEGASTLEELKILKRRVQRTPITQKIWYGIVGYYFRVVRFILEKVPYLHYVYNMSKLNKKLNIIRAHGYEPLYYGCMKNGEDLYILENQHIAEQARDTLGQPNNLGGSWMGAEHMDAHMRYWNKFIPIVEEVPVGLESFCCANAREYFEKYKKIYAFGV